MIKKKTTAIICTLVLVVSIFGSYTDYAKATKLPVTTDDASLSREAIKQDTAKNADTKKDVKQLNFGKKTQGRLVTGDDGQQYQITLDSSGQLDIHLEGDSGKMVTRLTDQNGKGWASRRRTADGKQTYQLKKGTYYYQVQAVKGTVIPKAGMDYAITATFKSAKAKFENNTTRKNAAKVPLDKEFYGHLAQNSPTEYYKFTLKRISQFSFTINTQVADETPETFVVSLYNKSGKLMRNWENPDWREYDGDWIWDREEFGREVGLVEVLPAGTYYIGVSIKRDENGKVPVAARYGSYKIYARAKLIGVSVELSHKQAEYTGKEIMPPKVTLKKHFKKAYYSDWYYDKDRKAYQIYPITKGVGGSFGNTIKGIGRYQIRQQRWSPPHGISSDNAYAIFTVTPVRGKINRISSKKSGELQVSVKKNAQSTGYQIQVARDKKFKKSVKTLKTTNPKETLEELSHGERYYVRMRNYKDVKTKYCLGGMEVSESIYGKWSKTRTVVCK